MDYDISRITLCTDNHGYIDLAVFHVKNPQGPGQWAQGNYQSNEQVFPT